MSKFDPGAKILTKNDKIPTKCIKKHSKRQNFNPGAKIISKSDKILIKSDKKIQDEKIVTPVQKF